MRVSHCRYRPTLAALAGFLMLMSGPASGQESNNTERKPANVETEDPAQVHADYKRLAGIYNRSETAEGLKAITKEERKFVLQMLRRRTGLWFAHDFPRMAALVEENLRDAEAVPALIELLPLRRKHYYMVGAHAATALGNVGDPVALPHLLKAIADDRALVGFRAAKSILENADKWKNELRKHRTPAHFRRVLVILSTLPLPKKEKDDGAAISFRDLSHQFDTFPAQYVGAVCGVAMLLMPEPINPEDEGLATRVAQLVRNSHIPKAYLSSPSMPHLRRFLEKFGDARGK